MSASGATADDAIEAVAVNTFDLLHHDMYSMVTSTIVRAAFEYRDPSSLQHALNGSPRPHHNQLVTLGALRSAVDTGVYPYDESVYAARTMRDENYFQNVVEQPDVMNTLRERFDNPEVGALRNAREVASILQPFYELALSVPSVCAMFRLKGDHRKGFAKMPDVMPNDIAMLNGPQLCVVAHVIRNMPSGTRVHIASIVQTQRAITTLRLVCRAWARQFKQHLFLPSAVVIQDMTAASESAGYVEESARLPFVNARSNSAACVRVSRTAPHTKSDGVHAWRSQFLPATLAWKLARQLSIDVEYKAPDGRWRESASVEVTGEQHCAAKSRTPRRSTVRDKMEPVQGFTARPAFGKRAVYNLVQEPDAMNWYMYHPPGASVDPQFKLNVPHPHLTMCTLMHHPLLPTASTKEWGHCNAFALTRAACQDSRATRPVLTAVHTDLRLSFKLTKTSAQLASNARGKAPLRLRLRFALGDGPRAPSHTLRSTPFYCFWQDKCIEKRKQRGEKDAEASRKRALTDAGA